MSTTNRRFATSKIGINVRAFCRTLYSGIFSYSTVREINVEYKPVAVVYRLVQLLILVYIIGYDIIWNKGYQTTDGVTSTVTTKVKGLGYVSSFGNFTVNHDEIQKPDEILTKIREVYNASNSATFKTFDTADYIVPANEYNSIFIMTNFIETQQSRGVCEESYTRIMSKCNDDSDCLKKSIPINTWNGLPTGKCIESTILNQTKLCEINAWCPVENDINTGANMIINSLSYTIFIKNDIEFKKFKRKERNILPGITNYYISTCTYDEVLDPYCPVFSLEKVLKKAEPDSKERLMMLQRGGVVEIGISWSCNYDSYAKRCLPKYSFTRFDLPFKQTSTASGFNFRFASRYYLDGEEFRSLYKAYGIRLFISVTGQAGKFNIVPLMTTIGAGIGLMGISVIFADCIMMNFTKKKYLFQRFKELDMNEAGKTSNENGVQVEEA